MKQNFCLNRNQDTPTASCSSEWRELSHQRKHNAIADALSTSSIFNEFSLKTLSNNGQDLYVDCSLPMQANERGGLLLDLEQFLAENVDQGLRVWFEVTADKSKLRNLRGVSPV
jgi:hypothetical protein